ncbi:hypothetical protein GSI_12746 [Ganoderma sinense ZZ0214-1]|uniref:Uncharacterized protein n=1 Tax=Ganoderma sinense ZZ0214-1 TaxID=1077348 RepID=A0A2G8RTN3_9APHY|nr:hypothetical protein GSI_12746 [Ganoderma sinense ZZ0214-1]
MDDRQADHTDARHLHVCYSRLCQPSLSPTNDSEDPPRYPQIGQCPCTACTLDARSVYSVPGGGSSYDLEGRHVPGDHAQLYVGPVQRDYVERAPRWTSLPPDWPDTTPHFVSSYSSSQLMTLSTSRVPVVANSYTAFNRSHLSAQSTKFVPLHLEQDPTGAFIVAQTNYDCGQPFPTTTLSEPCAYEGFSLSNAIANSFCTLSNAREVAFPGVTFGQKISVRLRLVDCPQYDHQGTVAGRVGKARSSPTRAVLANLVAREIKRFIDHQRASEHPLTHLGRAITLDDLYLMTVKHVSPASIQPVIALVLNV